MSSWLYFVSCISPFHWRASFDTYVHTCILCLRPIQPASVDAFSAHLIARATNKTFSAVCESTLRVRGGRERGLPYGYSHLVFLVSSTILPLCVLFPFSYLQQSATLASSRFAVCIYLICLPTSIALPLVARTINWKLAVNHICKPQPFTHTIRCTTRLSFHPHLAA